MRTFRPDPKPEARVIDFSAGRDKLLAEGKCRLCHSRIRELSGRCSLTRHHLIRRGQGGDDVDANLVPLCGHGTTGCHGDVEHDRSDARHRLRQRLRRDEVAYCVGKVGAARFDKMYPPESALTRRRGRR